jgi:hypothetical protein
MQFEYEIYTTDNLLTIHKKDETYIDIKLNTFLLWVNQNDLNKEYDGKEVINDYSNDEYLNLPYHTIKEHISQYLLTPKFKRYF